MQVINNEYEIMMYYLLYFLIFTSSILEIFFTSNSKYFYKNKLFIFILFYFTVFILLTYVSIRNGAIVGTDSPAYFVFYQDIYPNVEIGYKSLNAFFSINDVHYNIFLFIINFISIFSISWFIKNNSPFLLFPLLIFYSDFYLYYNFSGIRQATAMGLVLISFNFFHKKNNLIGVLFIILGMMFHITALIGLFALFVPKVKIKFLDFIKILIILFFSAIIINKLIEYIPYLSYKFLYYSELQEKSEELIDNFYIGLFKRFLLIGSIILVVKKFFDSNYIYYLHLYILGFFIYCISYLISPDFGVRFSSYFIILDGILVAQYIALSKSFTNKLFYTLLFSCIALYKVYTYTLIPTYYYEVFFK